MEKQQVLFKVTATGWEIRDVRSALMLLDHGSSVSP